MTYRKLITYSPLLLTVVMTVGLCFPSVIYAAPVAAAGTPTTVAAWLYDVVLNFFGTLAGLSAVFLNYAVNQFVLNFGGLVTGSGMGAAINNMWSIVRDFFNIIFIFAIIYLGFKMILGSDDSGTKRALVYLIIAALLVNFSLFISKFVVDFSNILAGEVATAAFPAYKNAGGAATPGTVDIGTNFFNMMQIPTSLTTGARVLNGNASEWGYIFGIALVYIIAMFAFAAGAVMLMIRYAALCIFMVLSPFMFIGWVLPQYASLMRKYWSGFLGRAFFAPAYIVLLYFSGAVIQASFGQGTGASGQGIGNAFTGAGTAATASSFGAGLGPFILSAVFMIMSVQVASKLSADGAGTAMRIGGNLARRGRRVATNTAMYYPRRGAQNAVAIGGAGVSGATNLARRTRLGRFATNNAAGQALLNARNASKQVKLGAGTTMRDRDSARAAMKSQSDREVKLRKAEDLKRRKKEHKYDYTDRQTIADAVEAANDYGAKDIENMTPAQRKQITPYLKAATVAKLLESDQLTAKEKGKIQGDYSAAIHDKIVENGEVVTEEITNLSIKQLEILGDQFVRDYAGFLSEGQMDDLKKSDRFTEGQKGAHKASRKEMFKKFGRDDTVSVTDPKNPGGKPITLTNTNRYLFKETKRNSDGVIESGKSLKAVELAARPIETFVGADGKIRDEARDYLSADVLKQIARNSQQGKPTLSDAEREQLAQAVVNTRGLNPRVYSYLTKEKAEEDFFMSPSMKQRAQSEVRRANDDRDIRDAVGGGTLGM